MKTPEAIKYPLILLPLLALASCQDPAARMAKGFRLPEGNIEHGQAAFLDLNCQQCHTVAGANLPKSEAPSAVTYELGGEVRKVKSYGELVTSIIQPQHVVAAEYLDKLKKDERPGTASPMPSFNDRMTVTQMTDIVTFLHSYYKKAPPPGANYPVYMP